MDSRLDSSLTSSDAAFVFFFLFCLVGLGVSSARDGGGGEVDDDVVIFKGGASFPPDGGIRCCSFATSSVSMEDDSIIPWTPNPQR